MLNITLLVIMVMLVLLVFSSITITFQHHQTTLTYTKASPKQTVKSVFLRNNFYLKNFNITVYNSEGKIG